MKRTLVMTVVGTMVMLALISVPASAGNVVCNSTLDPNGNPEFEVCFVHVGYNNDGTSTWTYTVQNMQQVQQGAELSNWALELCDPTFGLLPITTWTTPAAFSHAAPPSPSDTHFGEAGATYDVTVSLGQNINRYGFPGIKWDATGNKLGLGETHIFQFGLNAHYAFTAGLDLGVGTKDGGGPQVDRLLHGIGGPSCPPTAVKLASFVAQAGAGSVTLTWETAAEYDNAGFNLYRATSPLGPYVQVNKDLIAAKGDATVGALYTFVDSSGYGTYYYRLEDVDYFGVSSRHDPLEIIMIAPFRRPLFRPKYPTYPLARIQ